MTLGQLIQNIKNAKTLMSNQMNEPVIAIINEIGPNFDMK